MALNQTRLVKPVKKLRKLLKKLDGDAAPEQVRGEEVDRRMDLYSMAVVLYKLLSREAVRYKQVLDYLAQYGHG